MSWVTAVPRSNDVFDEDMDELSLQNKEWRSNMEKRSKDGYRDGIDAGKEASLQQGFNLGYREGAAQMKTIGQFKGIVGALQCWCQSHASVGSVPIIQLLQEVEKHEESIFEAMRSTQKHPSSSVSEIVEDLDDLGVHQRDERCQKEQRDCLGDDKDSNESSDKIYSEKLFVKEDSLEQLLHKCLELVNKLELPEELRLYIQQLRHA
ncbi:Yae1 domain-containing protein 1 [Bagarius yarrelli]|uniref:Yae1 domain-containing protein 1 n=1 Tax=Bagarius yarrelli TaxID=175774 RepID=A0A556TXH0_BAGYA|nr:Yae1 domain-containing protein 1 [Bagarius yarrelli]